MSGKGNTVHMFIVAILIILVVIFFANRFHSLDYAPVVELMSFTGGKSKRKGMLATDKELGYLDNTDRIADIIGYIGYYPNVVEGDNRDDMHKGMLTNDPLYVALFHLMEFDLIDHLSDIQVTSVMAYIAKQIRSKQTRSNNVKGSNHGISGNVTTYKVVRAFHCKYNRQFKFIAYSNGHVLFSVSTGRHEDGRSLFVIDDVGTISSYDDFKAAK